MAAKTTQAEPSVAAELPLNEVLRPHSMPRSKATRFDVAPAADKRNKMAEFLGILSVDEARFKGEIRPVSKEDWIAEGRLTARVVQACVISLAPVTQEIDEIVRRRFVPEDELAPQDEIDLDVEDDEEIDGYDDRIDLGLLMTEAMALALDPYPRAEDAELADAEFSPPGADPISDDVIKPFAKLAALREKLSDEKS